MCRGLVIDDNASSGKSGPQHQTGNANERCLKAVGQGKSKLDSLFGVALNIDVNHHRCERHTLFPLATIRQRTDRTFRRGAMVAMSVALILVTSEGRPFSDRGLNAALMEEPEC